MDNSRFMQMIRRNTMIIENIKKPTEEMQLLAKSKNGFAVEYIEKPTE